MSFKSFGWPIIFSQLFHHKFLLWQISDMIITELNTAYRELQKPEKRQPQIRGYTLKIENFMMIHLKIYHCV